MTGGILLRTRLIMVLLLFWFPQKTPSPPRGERAFSGKIAIVTDDNPRRAFSLIAARYFGRQPETIAIVTGTNGKTSIVHFTQQLWRVLGVQAAGIGTLTGALTTPDPVSLYEALANLAASGVTHVAMEASSHGLDQYRLDGVNAATAAFTNISRDHLDYHGSMEDYFAAKARLFTDILQPGGVAVFNADIEEYDALKGTLGEVRHLSYGWKGKDICLLDRTVLPNGQKIVIEVLGNKHTLTLPLVGEFQLMNVLCALGIVMAEEPDNTARTEKIVEALSTLEGAPGRLQPVPHCPEGSAIYIDYAHTPDALKNVLKALRSHTDSRLICVIGCGGDRDAGKRPLMGRIAVELADVAVITDDNPRTEDPAAIRQEMLAGSAGAKEIPGRREAIGWAVSALQDGDVLVIAGKGHEQGQVIGKEVLPFDDFEEAVKAVMARQDIAVGGGA